MMLVSNNFGENLDEVVQGIPIEEKIFIEGDFNGHVGTSRFGFENVHGGCGFGDRNEARHNPRMSMEDSCIGSSVNFFISWFL